MRGGDSIPCYPPTPRSSVLYALHLLQHARSPGARSGPRVGVTASCNHGFFWEMCIESKRDHHCLVYKYQSHAMRLYVFGQTETCETRCSCSCSCHAQGTTKSMCWFRHPFSSTLVLLCILCSLDGSYRDAAGNAKRIPRRRRRNGAQHGGELVPVRYPRNFVKCKCFLEERVGL